MRKTYLTVVIVIMAVTALAASVSAQHHIASCTGTQLKLTEGQGDADMGGKRYSNFIFENVSRRPCTLRGFPKFNAVDRRGHSPRTMKVEYTNNYPAGEYTGKKPETVTLRAGEKAWFQIFYNDGMALDHKKPFTNVSKLSISAPRDAKVFTLKGAFAPCCGIQVSSVRSGTPN